MTTGSPVTTTVTTARRTTRRPDPHPVPARALIRWTAWLVATWTVAFALVNVYLQFTLDHDLFASWAAFTALNLSMVVLKLVGAGVARETVSTRPRLPARWTSFLAAGGAAVLLGYAAVLFAMIATTGSWGTTVSAGGVLDVPASGYAAFFAVPGLALATTAIDHRRRTQVRRAWMLAGTVGAPVLLVALMGVMQAAFG